MAGGRAGGEVAVQDLDRLLLLRRAQRVPQRHLRPLQPAVHGGRFEVRPAVVAGLANLKNYW